MDIIHIGITGFVDHKDRNKLNCQRENLRQATYAENQRNVGPRPNGTSNFKGVSYHSQSGKWWARITVNKKTISLGTQQEAALAYDKAAIEYFGEFACLNH